MNEQQQKKNLIQKHSNHQSFLPRAHVYIKSNPIQITLLLVITIFVFSIGYKLSHHLSPLVDFPQRSVPFSMRRKIQFMNKIQVPQSTEKGIDPYLFNGLLQLQSKQQKQEIKNGFRLWIVQKRKVELVKINKNAVKQIGKCALVNSLNIIKQSTISSIKQILNKDSLSKVFVISTNHDKYSQKMMNQFLKKDPLYKIQNKRVIVDSDYIFLTKQIEQCSKLAYLFGNFHINQQKAQSLSKQMDKLSNFQMSYSSYYQVDSKRVKLPSLLKKRLQQIKIQQIYMYLYIFDVSLLKIITPLNFAYYAKYTLQEMIILPLLAILQNSDKLKQSKQIMHSYKTNIVQYKQFFFNQPQPINNSLCFVSYPIDPQAVSINDLNLYLQSIFLMKKQLSKISLIINLPYRFSHGFSYMTLAEKLATSSSKYNLTRVRLRLRSNKTVSSFSLHEAAYYYCPKNSFIVGSRHNVVFQHDFAQQIIQEINSKYHLVLTNFYLDETKVQVSDSILEGKQLISSDIYQQYFKHFQIFNSNLLKTLPPQLLKSQQVQFYETEASLIYFMLQTTNFSFSYINKTLARVNSRVETQKEQTQIASFQYFQNYGIQNGNKLTTYQHRFLHNRAFRKLSADLIQKNIHQIWLYSQSMPKFLTILRNTIKAKNPGFKIFVWKLQNITKYQFPLTYNLLFQFGFPVINKTTVQSIKQILKFQILYNHGGIYIDEKSQGKKSLKPFLKYQMLFLGGSRLVNGKNVLQWSKLIGATKNHELLQQLLVSASNFKRFESITSPNNMNQNNSIDDINYLFFQSPSMINNIGYSGYLIQPHGYSNMKNACMKPQNIEKEQQIYELLSQDRKVIKIGLPCKQYHEAFIINYNILTRFQMQQVKSTNQEL